MWLTVSQKANRRKKGLHSITSRFWDIATIGS